MIFFGWFVYSAFGFAQGIEIRKPSEQVIQDYLTNPIYVYDRIPAPPMSVLDIILAAIFDFIRSIFNSRFYNTYEYYIELFSVLLITGLILYVIVKKLYLFQGVVGSTQAHSKDIPTDIKNITEADLNALEEMYLKQGAYKEVLRILYLKVLKSFSINSLILLEKRKTNWDYVYELNGKSVQSQFIGFTVLFERIWYGGEPVTAEQVENFRNLIEIDPKR